MATENEIQQRLGQFAALLRAAVEQLGGNAPPDLVAQLVREIDNQRAAWERSDAAKPAPSDQGLAQLIGLGPDAVENVGGAFLPQGLPDMGADVVSAEKLNAAADIYYVYQHERAGVFEAIERLSDRFDSGALRTSTGAVPGHRVRAVGGGGRGGLPDEFGEGALRLYRFKRRKVLRATAEERESLYRVVLGQGLATRSPEGADAGLSRFAQAVAAFFVQGTPPPTSASVDLNALAQARVRSAGEDLRRTLAATSFGSAVILSVELMQTLAEAFTVLQADDVKALFGATTGWDVLEVVLAEPSRALPPIAVHHRRADSGRNILRWLAQPFILQTDPGKFSELLMDVATPAQEWMACAPVA